MSLHETHFNFVFQVKKLAGLQVETGAHIDKDNGRLRVMTVTMLKP
ncbi:MAG TPA: hypothetical protein VIX91_11125 [Candidatus Acidoferrum sp.]